VKWHERIPNIETERWVALWVHSVEAYNDFETDAARIREQARTMPARREAFLRVYDYILANPPTTREWFWATDTSFCTRAQLLEYLQAFYDYVFGERPAPIPPPPSDEVCQHERTDRGQCVLAVAERAAEDEAAAASASPGDRAGHEHQDQDQDQDEDPNR
jgi:hypothetical protein